MDKITEISKAIEIDERELSTLRNELEITLNIRNNLKIQEEHLKHEIKQVQDNLSEYKIKSEELLKEKLPDMQWRLTKMDIDLENNKSNSVFYKKYMEAHKEAWKVNEYNKKEEKNMDVSKLNEDKTKECSDVPLKLEIEAQAAELSLKKTECLENIEKEKQKYKTLFNRNKAQILKLRKDLQKCETYRKSVVEKYKVIIEDIEKMEKQQY